MPKGEMTNSIKYECNTELKEDGGAVKLAAPKGGIRVLDSTKE
jgi:hypothetical protein